MTDRTDKTPAIIRWDQSYNRNGNRELPRDVVNVIRIYMDNHNLQGWVKQETLAKATGLSLRTVKRQIAQNIAAGWLKIAERGNSSGWSNSYELTYPEMVSDMTPNGDTDGTPTTLRTSPKRSSLTTDTLTTNKSGDIRVTTSGDGLNNPEPGIEPVCADTDPWSEHPSVDATTTEFNGVINDPLILPDPASAVLAVDYSAPKPLRRDEDPWAEISARRTGLDPFSENPSFLWG